MPTCPSSAVCTLFHEPARRIKRPACVITNPVWRFFQGKRIKAAQRMFVPRNASRMANALLR